MKTKKVLTVQSILKEFHMCHLYKFIIIPLSFFIIGSISQAEQITINEINSIENYAYGVLGNYEKSEGTDGSIQYAKLISYLDPACRYENSVITDEQILFNGRGEEEVVDSETEGDAEDALFTADWYEDLLENQGLMGNGIRYTKAGTGSSYEGGWFSWQCGKMNPWIFSSFSNYWHGFHGIGSQFNLKNNTNSVPEPGTSSLMIMAFACLSGIAAFKKKRVR